MSDQFLTRSSGVTVKLPLFIPVYRPDFSFRLFRREYVRYGLSAIMVNAFLLYRNRELRESFEQGYTLREHLGGFPGMLCTDSGAFQQLGGRKVRLDARDIVAFQDAMRADIVAPLDLITPPETGYDETLRRMIVSHHRIEEAASLCEYSDLSAIQQGGGFYSLRQKHIRDLATVGFRYYGIGSMVPFFNKNHDLHFTCSVIRDARRVVGPHVPIHVYGAGDPLDMAFMYRSGANVFDSSSYAHYAESGFYMTPYGALRKAPECEILEYRCDCPVCSSHSPNEIFHKTHGESLRREHNLFLLLDTVRVLRRCTQENRLDEHLAEIHDRHVAHPSLFPNSKLAESWDNFLAERNCDRTACDSRASCGVAPVGTSNGTSDTTKNAPEFTELEENLLEFLAEESARTYKRNKDEILGFLRNDLSEPKNAALRGKIARAKSLKDIRRTNEYDVFRKKTRAYFYRDLRRYKSSDYDPEAFLADLIASTGEQTTILLRKLLESHVSTRERLPFRETFLANLETIVAPGSTVIDIGCGFNPLMLPPEFHAKLGCYVAVDRDSEAIEAVRVYARKFRIATLHAHTWEIGSGLSILRRLTGRTCYDFALALKIVPVLARAEKNRHDRGEGTPLAVLGRFPATTMLATVSKESMTKRENIEKRELAVLNRFIANCGCRRTGKFACGNEFGYCFKRTDDEPVSQT